MLYRPLYRGETLWGKTNHTEGEGRAGLRVDCPETSWVTVPTPELRIIDDKLWTAAQQRLRARHDDYLRDTRGKLWGKPDLRREGRYLLSGLAQCGVCGWNIVVLGGQRRVYGCGHAVKRGVCANTLQQPVDRVDAAFLDALGGRPSPQSAFAMLSSMGWSRRWRKWRPIRPGHPPSNRSGRPSGGRSNGWWRRSMRGAARRPWCRRSPGREVRITEIEGELARLASAPAVLALDLDAIEQAVARQLGRFVNRLRGNAHRARQVLKKLLVDRTQFRPVEADGGRQTLAIRGYLSYGAILSTQKNNRRPSPENRRPSAQGSFH